MCKLGYELFYEGQRLALAWAKDSTGQMRGKDYYLGLVKADQRKVLARMRRYAEVGVIHNDEQFRHITGSVFEFKVHKRRLVGCRHRSLFVVCDGFDKKTDRDRRSDRQLDAAVRRATDWLDANKKETS